ncbi:MAG TPA: hypothetical protein VFA58_08480, partial [Chthoniobacterales bacterium]|nr:hypothetical protein [Chthoniobacterales bacterium]
MSAERSPAGHRRLKRQSSAALVSATATPQPGPTVIPLQEPDFNSPSVFSISGKNVGLGGMYSMVHADFNGDGIPDLASVGFYCARP